MSALGMVQCDRCLVDARVGTIVSFYVGGQEHALCWACVVRVCEVWCQDNAAAIARFRVARDERKGGG